MSLPTEKYDPGREPYKNPALLAELARQLHKELVDAGTDCGFARLSNDLLM